MKRSLVLVLLTGMLQAHDFKESPRAAVIDEFFEAQENHFVRSQKDNFSPRIDPCTGALSLQVVDFTVAGIQPLSVSRSYTQFAPPEVRTGGWLFQKTTFLVGNLEFSEQERFLSAGSHSGGIFPLFHREGTEWRGNAQQSHWVNSSQSGKCHPDHLLFSYDKLIDPKNTLRFIIHGSLKEGNGSERFFCSAMHSWNDTVTRIVRKKGFLFAGTKLTYAFHPKNWTPYQIPVQEERLPNGNWLIYTYQEWRENTLYPRPPLLKSITAMDRDKSSILNSLVFHYTIEREPRSDFQWEKSFEYIKGFSIVGSDGRKASYTCNGKYQPLLEQTVLPNGDHLNYHYDDQSRLKSYARNGEILLTIDYDDKGRVCSLTENNKFCTKWVYHEGKTTQIDPLNQRIDYYFDAHKRPIKTIWFEKGQPVLEKEEKWSEHGDLLLSCYRNPLGTELEKRSYIYDKNHNVAHETLSNGQESRETSYSYSEDGFNLITKELDPIGRQWQYTYLQGTSLCTARFLLYKGEILKRHFYHYNSSGACVEEIIDDGRSYNIDDLSTVSFRTVKKIRPKKNGSCIGLPEEVEQWTQSSNRDLHFLGKTLYDYAPFGELSQQSVFDAQGKLVATEHHLYDERELCRANVDPEGHTTQYGYDNQGRIVQVVGPLADHQKEIQYDNAGHLTRITERYKELPELTLAYTYDALGRIREEIDSSGAKTQYILDRFGRKTSAQYANGTEESWEYTELGHMISHVNELKEKTLFKTDLQGNIIEKSFADGLKESWVFDGAGREIEHIDSLGTRHRKEFDPFDNIIFEESVDPSGVSLKQSHATYSPFHPLTKRDPMGLLTRYIYNAKGQNVRIEQGERVIEKEYDAAGRVAIERAGGFALHNFYNARGEKVRIERRSYNGKLQKWTEHAFDAHGNEILTKDPAGVWSFTYTPFNQILEQRDPVGNVTSYNYCFKGGKRIEKLMPNGSRLTTHFDTKDRECIKTVHSKEGELLRCEQKTYDACGKLLSHTLTPYKNGEALIAQIHRWTYGMCGRLSTFQESGRPLKEYLYNTKGLLIEEKKCNGQSIYREYDSLGQVQRLWGEGIEYTYSYDALGRILSIENVQTHAQTNRTYTYFGELESEKLETGAIFDSVYDNEGRRVQLHLPDTSSIETIFREGRFYQLTRSDATYEQTRYDLCSRPSLAYLPHKLGRLEMQWDQKGRLSKFNTPTYSFSSPTYDPHDNLLGYVENKTKHTFKYDALDQLIQETGKLCSYDSLYNRYTSTETLCVFDEANQLLKKEDETFPYDLNGNLLEYRGWKLKYDLLDRLVSAKNGKYEFQYHYDGLDRRLFSKQFVKDQLVHTQYFLWDDQEEIGEEDHEGNLLYLKVCDPSGHARIIELNGKSFFPIEDFRGNIVALQDKEGVYELSTFSAFGIEYSDQKHSNPWRFSGKRVDQETGFVYFGKRFYIPSLGRWLTPDPLGFEDGPNRYAYVHNHPLTAVDLEGLWERPYWWTYDLWGEMDNPTFMDTANLVLGAFSFSNDYKFEELFKEKSFTFMAGYNPSFGFSQMHPNKGISFINGICTSFEKALDHSDYLSNMASLPVHGIYNASHGFFADLLECSKQLYKDGMTEPVVLLASFFQDYFKEKGPDASLLHICHSQGAIISRNALYITPKNIRERIKLVCIAPGGYIGNHLCKEAKHYYSYKKDMVPFLDLGGHAKNYSGIWALSPKRTGFDHDFQSATFEKVLREEIAHYLNN